MLALVMSWLLALLFSLARLRRPAEYLRAWSLQTLEAVIADLEDHGPALNFWPDCLAALDRRLCDIEWCAWRLDPGAARPMLLASRGAPVRFSSLAARAHAMAKFFAAGPASTTTLARPRLRRGIKARALYAVRLHRRRKTVAFARERLRRPDPRALEFSG